MQNALKQAFLVQARACDDLGSPFMGHLMRALPEILPADTQLFRRLDEWPGDIGPSGASLPLRLAGGLHYLVLTGQDPGLAACYPPQEAVPDRAALAGALRRHDAFLAEWVHHAPQTNEVGRSAVLLAGAAVAADWSVRPLVVSELGASAGLNLNFPLYRLESDAISIGNPQAALVLKPDWRGHRTLPTGPVPVAESRGVDLNPLSPVADGLRLLSYVWPDQGDRLTRMRAALALAAAHPVAVDRGEAADWLEARLAGAQPGHCHLVCHTIAFQYFPADSKARIERAMTLAGRRATRATPLAWLAMEADDIPGSAGVTLRLWPGDLRIPLARAGYHGQWIDWQRM